jgi:hypothetical protein
MNLRAIAAGSAALVLTTALLAGRPAAADSRSYVPELGDIMEATQLRHLKLWYAGREKNWRLAEYELQRIKRSFQDAMMFYPGLPVANMVTMTRPAAQIGDAIKAHASAKFAKAFGDMTAACNSCHREQGYGFIVIKIPTAPPFSNEAFAP